MDLPMGFLFKGLNDDQLKEIDAVAEKLSMDKGQVICKEGSEAQALFILKTGAIELISKMDSIIEIPITMLRKPGEIFGSGVLVEPYAYALTARCASKGAFMRIEQSDLKNLIGMGRDLGCIIMTNLAQYYLKRLQENRKEIKIHLATLLKTFY